MKTASLALMICTGLMIQTPVMAQDKLGDILSGVAKGLVAQEVDRNAYNEAVQVNTAAAWRDYLARFPNGAYRATAERALARLDPPVVPVQPPATGTRPAPVTPPVAGTNPAPVIIDSAASAEAALSLSREQRRQIQVQLTSLGYNVGTADGLWGRNTRDAIRRWQTANGNDSTGYVTARQVRLIAEQGGPVATPPAGGANATDDALEERLLDLNLGERREIQRRLTDLGYSTGGADGVFGQNTRRAIGAWQREEGERATGYITADQLRELRRQTAATSG